MSPSEGQLRAALHAGEGDPVDADGVIGRARAARRQRRTTIAAVAGAVVAVMAIGTTVGVLAGRDDGTPTAAGTSSRVAAAVAAPAAGSEAATGAAQTPPSARRTSATPTSPPRAAVSGTPRGAIPPGAPSDGSATRTSPTVTPPPCPPAEPQLATGRRESGDAAGPLFPPGVVSIRICAYQSGTSHLAGSHEVSGDTAATYAARFNAIPGRILIACTDAFGPSVALLAATSDGTAVRPVVGNLDGCGWTTNGTAVRQARGLLQVITRMAFPQNGVPASPGGGPS